ncbi:MAG: ABC transporter permease [Gemmataceae bacterium]|nr:ABC transporter permease [Gemmataceae bacterium]MCS7270791.1 ABC transporter permease [Gemmataceae bacterium]MDW8242133.1 ABC transporter permease [Thermogemmata sp.]
MLQHIAAVWRYRYFLLALVKLDLRQRYRRSVLGLGWSLLHPLAMTAVFTVVFSNLLGGGDPTHYAASVLASLAVWGFLRDSALQGCRTFQANEAYIRQSPLPYTIYTLRTVLGQAIHALIALSIVFVMVAIFKQEIHVALRLILLVPALLIIFVSAWAIATIAAYINVYFHDTVHLLEVGSQFLFFLTPIMYSRRILDEKDLGWLVDANPVYWMLEMVRHPLLTGELVPLEMYIHAAAFSLLVTGLALGVIAWLHKRLIFHL